MIRIYDLSVSVPIISINTIYHGIIAVLHRVLIYLV